MKAILIITLCSLFIPVNYAQDTISANIYQMNGRLGIGNEYPGFLLHIEDNVDNHGVNPRQFIMLENLNNSMHSSVAMSLRSGTGSFLSEGSFGLTSRNYAAMAGLAGIAYVYNRDNGIALRADSENGTIKMLTGGDTPEHERMRIDASGRIGIGTPNPEFLLHINDDVDNSGNIPRQFIMLENENNTLHSSVAIAMRSGTGANLSEGSFGLTSRNYVAMNGLAGIAYVYNRDNGIALRADSYNGTIRMLTGGDTPKHERMRIDSAGRIGIGTLNPASRLQVADGDIFISDIDKGIIMKSPDGSCWRGTLDNDGKLNFSKVDCIDGSPNEIITENYTDENNFTIFPNPSSNEVHILVNNYTEKINLKIYSSNGNLLERLSILSDEYTRDISYFPTGVYIFRLEDMQGNLLSIKKIIRN